MTDTVMTQSLIKAYLELCKPRVVALMLVTALVGMMMASPGWLEVRTAMIALAGIALCAGAGAVVNHLLERDIDAYMSRTRLRPLPSGQVGPLQAIWFAFVLLLTGAGLLMVWVNALTAVLTALTVLGYGLIYTVFLKPATPQNIVLGGLAGAMPPLLGWTAMTGSIDPAGLLLVLIIFIWTPPHFWALAIYRLEEYQNVKVPMLPVTHGVKHTKRQILFYAIGLLAVSLLPFIYGISGPVYLLGAVCLGLKFVKASYDLWCCRDRQKAIELFRYSITYMFSLFGLMLLDHYLIVFMGGNL